MFKITSMHGVRNLVRNLTSILGGKMLMILQIRMALNKKYNLSLGVLGGIQSWLQQLDEGLWLGALWVLRNGKGKASVRHSEWGTDITSLCVTETELWMCHVKLPQTMGRASFTTSFSGIVATGRNQIITCFHYLSR